MRLPARDTNEASWIHHNYAPAPPHTLPSPAKKKRTKPQSRALLRHPARPWWTPPQTDFSSLFPLEARSRMRRRKLSPGMGGNFPLKHYGRCSSTLDIFPLKEVEICKPKKNPTKNTSDESFYLLSRFQNRTRVLCFV